jgi:hypothetical protein
MSCRFDVFFLNLVVNVFTGKMLVINWRSRCLSSFFLFEDLLMTDRKLGSRIGKSVVLVEVSGS